MKKIYSKIMMLAMMVAALGLTACGGDDDGDNGGNNSGTLVGKWKCTYVDYGKWESYAAESGTSVGDLICFNSDHTYYTVTADGNDESGTWSLSGNQLTVKSNDPYSYGITMVYDISLTANTFTITIDSMIFKYVRVDNDDEGVGNGDGGSSGMFTVTVDGDLRQRSQVMLNPQWISSKHTLRFDYSEISSIRFVYPESISIAYFSVGYSNFHYDAEKIVLGSPSQKLTYDSGSAVVTKNDGSNLTVKFSHYKFTWGTSRSVMFDGELTFKVSEN